MEINSSLEKANDILWKEQKTIDKNLLLSKVTEFYLELKKYSHLFSDKPTIKEIKDPRKLRTQHHFNKYIYLNHKVEDILESYSISKYTLNKSTQDKCIEISKILNTHDFSILPFSHNFRKIILKDLGITLSKADELYFELLNIVSEFCIYDKVFCYSLKNFVYREPNIISVKYPEYSIAMFYGYSVTDEAFEKLITHNIQNNKCTKCGIAVDFMVEKTISCIEGNIYSILE